MTSLECYYLYYNFLTFDIIKTANIVNSEIFARTLLLRIILKDIFVMLNSGLPRPVNMRVLFQLTSDGIDMSGQVFPG